MSHAEAGQSRHLLILLNDDFGFAGDFFRGDFDRNLAFDAVFFRVVLCVVFGDVGFCGTHCLPFQNRASCRLDVLACSARTWLYSYSVNLECKD